MKALAAIALIGLVSASEDNELFKFNNTQPNFPHHNHNRNSTLRPQPLHQNKAHNATVQPKPIRKVHPILFNRTQNAHIAKPQNEKKPVLKTFDDEELFLAENIPENQLNSKKGVGKWADRNKEWLAPVGHKVLDKLLSSFDDDELFNADINDDELAGFFGKVGSFVAKNKNVITPVATKLMGKFDDEELYQNVYASTWNKLVGKLDDDELYQNVYASTWNKLVGKLDDDELHTLAASTSAAEKKNVLASTLNKLLGNLDDEELHTLFLAAASQNQNQNKNVLASTFNKLLGKLDAEFDDEELANFFGKVGSFVAKNKNVITPVATKLIGRLDAEDDFEFRSTTGQVASQNKNVLASTFNKLMGKLDDEFDADELAFLASYNRVLQKNGPIVAKVGMKALPIIAFEGFGEDELFNLDAFLNDAVKTYNDARQNPRNYGNIVNDGIQLVKDIKQKNHDDEELFNFNAFLNDAIKTYNDARAQPRNYGDLVNDGIQIVKDIKQKKQDDEELYQNVVLSTGKKLFGIMDDELFNLDAFLNDAVKTYNDARAQPRNYGNIVNDGIQLVKDIKQKNHDDEELFQLGNLINEGLSREEFVKDAIKTISGVKPVSHPKKFLRH